MSVWNKYYWLSLLYPIVIFFYYLSLLIYFLNVYHQVFLISLSGGHSRIQILRRMNYYNPEIVWTFPRFILIISSLHISFWHFRPRFVFKTSDLCPGPVHYLPLFNLWIFSVWMSGLSLEFWNPINMTIKTKHMTSKHNSMLMLSLYLFVTMT